MSLSLPMNPGTPRAFLLALGAAASLFAVEITLPEETTRLAESPVPGYGLAVAHCYTCHSTDYISSQPPMTQAAWKASVLKMQKIFGATIPESAVEPIADYLAATYGLERGNATRPTAPAASGGKAKPGAR